MTDRSLPHSAPGGSAAGSPPIELAILSATTWRPVDVYLEAELAREGLAVRITHHEYESLDAEIATGKDTFDSVLLALDDDATLAALGDPGQSFDATDCGVLVSAWSQRAERLAPRCAQLLVLLPAIPEPPAYPLPDTAGERGLAHRVERLRRELRAALDEIPGVEAVDPEPWFHELGRARLLDARLWELGRVRYSTAGFRWIARDLARRLCSSLGRGVKAVIVDLDDTLWGGVVGEVGIEGVTLGDGYPGSCYRALQRELLGWKQAGILLAVASKNNRADALRVLDQHPEMLLRSEQFDHLEIHWRPKPESVARILARFNIGADAALFIDDNPRERAAVEAAFPAIRVLDFPAEPVELVQRLRQLPYPLLVSGSGEDARRSELAAQQGARRGAATAAVSRDDYLRSLAIRVHAAVDKPAHQARVAQLHQKTNQFNLDPVRLGAADIEAALGARDTAVVTLEYEDRFGDAGIVACGIVRRTGGQLVVRTFMVSCRVIGLGVEIALLASLVEALPGPSGAVLLPYRATERNAPARDFLRTLGKPRDGEALVLAARELPAVPEWITLERPVRAVEVDHVGG